MKKLFLSVGLTALLVIGTASIASAAPLEISGITGDSKTFIDVPRDKTVDWTLKIGIDNLANAVVMDQLEFVNDRFGFKSVAGMGGPGDY